MALALDAHAKVNLFLAVHGRRPDGYHEVETILHELSLADTLVLTPGEVPGRVDLVVGDGASVRGLPVTGGEDNLVVRAARAFATETGIGEGVRFHLTKRIPAGGGLGGGSSDAAAALRLLNAMHGLPVDADGLHRLAAGLGADVPFFLEGGTQRGRGTGTELSPVSPEPEFHFVLILPSVGTSTGAIYKNHVVDLTVRPDVPSIRSGSSTTSPMEIPISRDFRNDLEATALRLHPELAALRETVAAGYPGVRMSGSGSTFFVALSSEDEADQAMVRLAPLGGDGVALLRCRSQSGPRSEPRRSRFPGAS